MDEAPDDDSWFSWSLGENLDEGRHVPGPVNVENELAQFRAQWQKELKEGQESNTARNTRNDTKVVEPTIEEQAEYLFIQGVHAEQSGRLYDAIKYYRRAVQLVPDIEFRIKDYRPRRRSERTDSESSVGSCSENDEVEDLVQHFSNIKANDKSAICTSATETQQGHISALPWEIIMYIFKWVVSADLDIMSLERLSEVCRGFYVCARDEEMWKIICQKVYSVNCGRPGQYGTYRNMYMQKPHLRFNGCYISRTEYCRHGEHSLDGLYRPIHIVEYYRYLRIFPDGHVLMFTTPDNPYLALPKLRYHTSRHQGILYGNYKMTGDLVTAVLKRHRVTENNSYQYRYKYRRQQQTNKDAEQSYHVTLQLGSAGKRSHSQLVWSNYSVHTFYRSTGQEQLTDFDLSDKSYPNLVFSRVKSFTQRAEAPLQ